MRKRKRGLELRDGSKKNTGCIAGNREAIEAKENQIFEHPRKEKEKFRNIKAKSPSSVPLPKTLVHRGPKIKISLKKIVFYTRRNFWTIFCGFWRLLGRQEKEQKKKKKMKHMKNGKTKEKKKIEKQIIEQKEKEKTRNLKKGKTCKKREK